MKALANIILLNLVLCLPAPVVTVVSDLFTFHTSNMNNDQVITVEQMNNDQLVGWNLKFEPWLKDQFFPQLKKKHYTQDCVDCADIYFLTRFYINDTGHVTKFKIIREEIDCHGKTQEQNDELKKALVRDFSSWVFPASLHNLIIEAQMGQVTRC